MVLSWSLWFICSELDLICGSTAIVLEANMFTFVLRIDEDIFRGYFLFCT